MNKYRRALQRILRQYFTGKNAIFSRPERDWLLGVGIAGIGCVVVAIVGGQMFLVTQKTPPGSDRAEIDIEQIDTAALQETVDFIEDRELHHARYRRNPVEIVDPSRATASLDASRTQGPIRRQ